MSIKDGWYFDVDGAGADGSGFIVSKGHVCRLYPCGHFDDKSWDMMEDLEERLSRGHLKYADQGLVARILEMIAKDLES